MGQGMAPSFMEMYALVKNRNRVTTSVVIKIFRYVAGGIVN